MIRSSAFIAFLSGLLIVNNPRWLSPSYNVNASPPLLSAPVP
eukprot:CAMPEP_0181092920 /NCGR_PEP_ID=MMETSP1071-20121207/9170_1 /TAXON_ID=35127 /ORGANISM="Thalassiosira sp., Strain NH16" /LENGTH=41 /DNA_ID= /DNA_START= /DNA_END= /DNA_ORIENTATION=